MATKREVPSRACKCWTGRSCEKDGPAGCSTRGPYEGASTLYIPDLYLLRFLYVLRRLGRFDGQNALADVRLGLSLVHLRVKWLHARLASPLYYLVYTPDRQKVPSLVRYGALTAIFLVFASAAFGRTSRSTPFLTDASIRSRSISSLMVKAR